MEATRRIADLDPHDVALVERVFGERLESSAEAVLILRTADAVQHSPTPVDQHDVPEWCNVLEGLSDADLADFNASLESPVRLARSAP